jgi:hypothetical protein
MKLPRITGLDISLTHLRLEVRNHTSGDYKSISGDWQATSDEFSVLLGSESIASGSSRVLLATSSASVSVKTMVVSQTSESSTSTGSAPASSQFYTTFTQTDSSSTREASDLSGAPTLGLAPPSKPTFRRNLGAIAGGVVGGLVVIAIILGAVLLVLRKRKTNVKNVRLVAEADGKLADRKKIGGEFVPFENDYRPADADLPECVASRPRA